MKAINSLDKWQFVAKVNDTVTATRTTKMGWVDDITIKLVGLIEDNGLEVTYIKFHSSNREGLYDWGQNKRNALQFYNILKFTPRAYDPEIETEVPAEYAQLVSQLLNTKTGIEIKDRKWHLKRYRNCFVASELVDWLEENQNVVRAEAVSLAQRMQQAQIFAHVSDKKRIFSDGKFFFRFQICESCFADDDAVQKMDSEGASTSKEYKLKKKRFTSKLPFKKKSKSQDKGPDNSGFYQSVDRTKGPSTYIATWEGEQLTKPSQPVLKDKVYYFQKDDVLFDSLQESSTTKQGGVFFDIILSSKNVKNEAAVFINADDKASFWNGVKVVAV
eukprot:TRINITY_DN9203_c0_g1_i1.p1 TRINITY_DN9203_c0_g1~~TRINITY_DN9203_c0_g1_i1.p1  ORF type:complete len:364 (+),score=59.39 TRINITY_DN9203_c0_g1_i1:100-1092(+)